ncbi:MAG: hypothetical protein P4L98_04350 [Ancalomicrobiaceae bacterium]|nr:hypothetical protein [Ancalomicrobiaceae bacterium]
MHDDEASVTAIGVAAHRAAHQMPEGSVVFRDAVIRRLLFKIVCAAIGAAGPNIVRTQAQG